MAKIYTRTGDGGKTRLVGGSQVAKSDARLEAYGDVDELNSVLGVCLALGRAHEGAVLLHRPAYTTFLEDLPRLQNHLFFIGSLLACEDDELRPKLPPLPTGAVKALEARIDEWTGHLAPLREFILPGGHLLASHLHVARTVCRRTERATARLLESLPPGAHAEEMIYLNRLSDYLFTAARFVNSCLGEVDQVWRKDVT